jgi:hypothetical protein
MAIPRFIQLGEPSPPLKPMDQSRRGVIRIGEFYLLFFASNLPIKPLEQVKIAWLMLEIGCHAHQHGQKTYSVAILKMKTGRNLSMSGINSGDHYLPTYQILMISDNVEFFCSSDGELSLNNRDINFDTMIVHHLRNKKIQHCPISSKFDMWVDNGLQN